MRVEWQPGRGRKVRTDSPGLLEVGGVVVDGDLIRVHPHVGAIAADMPAFEAAIVVAEAGGPGLMTSRDGRTQYVKVLVDAGPREWVGGHLRAALVVCDAEGCVDHLRPHVVREDGRVQHWAPADDDPTVPWQLLIRRDDSGPWELVVNVPASKLSDSLVDRFVSDLHWRLATARRLNHISVEAP